MYESDINIAEKLSKEMVNLKKHFILLSIFLIANMFRKDTMKNPGGLFIDI